MNTRKSTKSATRASTVTINLNLDHSVAAGLKRFAEKISFEQAKAVLYPHVDKQIREDQVAAILIAFNQIDRALAEANVHTSPWIDTGKA
jgi:hypothetical protein